MTNDPKKPLNGQERQGSSMSGDGNAPIGPDSGCAGCWSAIVSINHSQGTHPPVW
ncbi:hypothetical protein [[Phormidium] sp. ETS-05]|uniref:hypothetical protein n=1 Tax=[Phormidium] sp. ETS-05 TaxID=222819 RepID=UPI0018EECF5B|nr:hypothetical protein [[Phormidium] sp. ETS-05]